MISFDTTGSMNAVIKSVRRNIHALVKTMKEADPDIRIGIIAHGDYCDKDSTYTIRSFDLTGDEDALHRFITETGNTYGGDSDECYELALNTARTAFSWRSGNEKMLVLIGDCDPHPVGYTCKECPGFVNTLDWKNEAGLLQELGVKIYAVHALAGYRSRAKAFYQTLAQTTGGVYLRLDQFSEISDLIIASCYSRFEEETFNRFVQIIRDKGKLSRSMASNLQQLSGKTYAVQTYADLQSSALVPVLPGRFQALYVEADCSIRDFVEANGIAFEKGRGFYELSKPETIQQYKEIILEDKKSGDMYSGGEVRKYLGLQPQRAAGGEHEKLRPQKTGEYIVYVQSTSVNRKLIGGTRFLYEVKDFDMPGTSTGTGGDSSVKFT